MSELFAGLTFLHAHYVVHRDLKPDNLMLARPCDPLAADFAATHAAPLLKIIDFGHSRAMPSGDQTLTANNRGTSLYRAPETIAFRGRARVYTTKVDVFSAGLVVWEMLARQLPWSHMSRSMMMVDMERAICAGERPPLPVSCPAGLVRRVVRRCGCSPCPRSNLLLYLYSVPSFLRAGRPTPPGARRPRRRSPWPRTTRCSR